MTNRATLSGSPPVSAKGSGVDAFPQIGEPVSTRVGLFLGGAAVLCWSFGSSLIYLGARRAGLWRFVAIACLISGALQLIYRLLYHGEVRTALFLPWRLWVGPLVCFIVYGLVWPQALAAASPEQVMGVNLINYLWPVLTVVFATWWVPGVRLTSWLVAAMLLACLGLLCANADAIGGFFRHTAAGGHSAGNPLAYGFASVAAIAWAVYSALLSRWRAWAGNYVTSPAGFLIIGVLALFRLAADPSPSAPMVWSALLPTLLYGVGPLAAGYLLWELALPRAKVQLLSVMAAATPVLSTAVLCCFLRQWPALNLLAAAGLVSAAVVLSMKEPKRAARPSGSGAK